MGQLRNHTSKCQKGIRQLNIKIFFLSLERIFKLIRIRINNLIYGLPILTYDVQAWSVRKIIMIELRSNAENSFKKRKLMIFTHGYI